MEKLEYMNEEVLFQESGEVSEQVGAIIILIMGVSVATMMIIFSGVLSGQVYTETAPDLITLNSTDPTSYGYVQTAIQSGFKGLKVTGTYLPIVVLAVIIFIVLGLVMSLARPASSGGGVL